MTLVGFPSSDFPPPPRFSLRIPDGWRAAWPAGTLLAVHGSARDSGVLPTVLVAHQRVPPGTDFDAVLASVMDELREATPARELEPPRRMKLERAINAALLTGAFYTEAGVRVLQRQLIVEVESAGLGTAILELTATCEPVDLEIIEAIEASFEYAPAGAESLLTQTTS